MVGYSIADSVFVWLDFQRTLYPDFVSPDHVPPGNGTLGTFELYQSKPNPSYGDATITFTVPETTDVRLAVYDIAGRKIAVLADDVLPAGEHTYEVSELPAGVYVYRLVAGSYIAVKKMVVL
ncbi:MAG: T9SS type A sorting domain-containing protein [Candidatus Coatesbacteria bacterium]|nr:MAG: T9SS type A sorting domain-containing protein [Candidatus Coatesbacteria bacterium]